MPRPSRDHCGVSAEARDRGGDRHLGVCPIAQLALGDVDDRRFGALSCRVDLTAQVNDTPPRMPTTPEDNPYTATGVRRIVVVVSPSSWLPLVPQHLAAPAVV